MSGKISGIVWLVKMLMVSWDSESYTPITMLLNLFCCKNQLFLMRNATRKSLKLEYVDETIHTERQVGILVGNYGEKRLIV